MIARTSVAISIAATLPGITLAVTPDPVFSIQIGGAQLPSAFQAAIHNLGPAADTHAISFANVPSGFAVLASNPDVNILPGKTGIVGLYLQPTGGQLPSPGTQLSFDVTATSANDPTIHQSTTVVFIMPALDALDFIANSPAESSTPGVSINDTITITNVGNVSEDSIMLSTVLPAGLTVTDLPPTISLAVGQSTTFTVVLTPAASVPLNSLLNTRIVATFGPVGSAQTQTFDIGVNVVVPGAAAIAIASTAAAELGDSDLANRLGNLSIALTNLVQDPSSSVFKSQALANLTSIESLLAVDPTLVLFAQPLSIATDALANAQTAPQIQAAVVALGNVLDTFAETVTALRHHNVEVSLIPNSLVAQQGVAQHFGVLVHNVGDQTTTYDLSLLELPAGVTGDFSLTSITLDPGQYSNGLFATLTQNDPGELQAFEFQVIATAAGFPTVSKSVPGTMRARAETVSVVSVAASPPFADTGSTIAVSARVLNAVNRQQDALAWFEVRDPNGNLVFTSPSVSFALSVAESLATVNLGTFDTTGFANGEYTIIATIADARGTPIVGASQEGRVLIGSPVTASITVGPETLPPGTHTVTNTLVIDNKSGDLDPPSLVGLASVAGANDAIRNGDYVYVASRAGISVFNIAGENLNNPQLLRVVGTGTDLLKIRGNLLVAVRGGNDGANLPNSTKLDTYSLTDPANPQFLGTTGELPFSDAADFMLTDTDAFIVHINLHTFFGFTIYSQTGSVIAVNITNPAAPFFDGDAVSASGTPAGRDGVNDGLLFNDYGTNIDGLSSNGLVDESGGKHTTWAITQVSPTIAYVSGSSSTGTDTQTGVGLVHVVDISDPRNIHVIRDLEIPGTVHVVAIDVVGTKAFITASTGGWHQNSTDARFTGNAVLASLDISDPANPQLIHTQVLAEPALGLGYSQIVSLGGGLFAYGNQDDAATDPGLFVFDANDPSNIHFIGLDIPSQIVRMSGDGDLLFSADRSSLIIYQVLAFSTIPVTAQVQIPNNTDVSVVPGSFNIAPTSIVHGTDFDTLKWDLTLGGASPTSSITWQSTISNLQPGETRAVTLDSTVDFTSQGADGALTLPPQNVLAKQILSLAPAANTARPGETAAYTLTIVNPTQSPVTYNLSTTGVPADWVGLQSQVTVAAGGSVDVPITITADPFAPLSELGFVVSATTGGVSGSVEGELDLVGTPLLPAADPVARGVVAALLPTSATAGRGTSASYTVQVTNTGSATDTFALSTAGLPAGITASFEQSSVEVPPGAGNFLDITLTLTAAGNLAPSAYPFQVQAVSAADSSISDTAAGALNVVSQGVQATLSPSAGPPGTTFQLTVTNAGTASDTFNLSLSGPAALVSTLAATQITLAAGASRVVNITTTAINFADPGSLPLFATATSQANSAVKSTDGTSLTISPTQGLTAAFTPASQTLMQPGAADFSLNVNNIGNTEDSFVASIIGVSGPISAMLMGLDGQPTNSIPLFRLPGLASGQLQLLTNSSTVGTGNVTVKIASLTDPNQSVTVQAQLRIGNPNNVGNAGILLLDTSGKGALTNSGNGGIRVNGGGHIVIDSNNSKAGIDTGKGVISAAEIDVVGKLYTAGKGKFQGTIVQNAARVADPLAALAPPTAASPTFKCANISGKKTVTLSPGTYVGGIKITGSASVTLLPGIYYLQGGGLSISGTAKLTGDGVMIYNVPKKSCDGINIAPNTTVTLSAPTSGTYQSIVLFEQRSTKAPINISGGNVSLTGIVYAPSAKLAFAGNKSVNINSNAALGISAALILADLVSSGNGAIVVNVDPSQVSPTLQTSMSASASLRTASVLAVPQTKASDANEQQFHKSTATSVSNGATPRPVPSPLLQAALTQFSLSDWDEVTAHATPKAVDEIFSALAGFETQKIFPSI